MIVSLIQNNKRKKVFKKIDKVVKSINNLKEMLRQKSDENLVAWTDEVRQKIRSKGSFDNNDIAHVFATAREWSYRVKQMEHYDVQLMGGLILIDNNVAEMRTGEGKTLVATLPTIMYGLLGKGVHVITVNEYLASRDAELMRPVYEKMGLSVGVLLRDQSKAEKKAIYACDIVYGTSNEFGFDYLRDNMVSDLSEKVQREHFFALIDEVDSVLIDEARTPLIISGEADEADDMTRISNFIINNPFPLERDTHYEVNYGHHEVILNDKGYNEIEHRFEHFNLINKEHIYQSQNLRWQHFITNALRAKELYIKDVEYVVQDGEIVIVDENTGRIMKGRRWSHGIHQAIEVKEGVEIQKESKTLATISLQNYFKLYQHLAGMTGTALTESEEFETIYGLYVIPVPTHKPVARVDHNDMVYKTIKGKVKAILKDIQERHAKLQPILLGTNSVESSMMFSEELKSLNIPHNVLNAKEHEREAFIIEQAGRPGAITIATNMAGRGTDIILGGNIESLLKAVHLHEELTNEQKDQAVAELKKQWVLDRDSVLTAGGLHVLGTERNPSRRVDNQLRGRSGRQGDIGSSQFFVSMEDDLMKKFGGEKIKEWMTRLGVGDDDVIQQGAMTRQIEKAQRQMEGHNFDSRKNMLSFDNVLNDQRSAIYKERDDILRQDDVSDRWDNWAPSFVQDIVYDYCPVHSFEEQWDLVGLQQKIMEQFHVLIEPVEWMKSNPTWEQSHLVDETLQAVMHHFNALKEQHPSWNIFLKMALVQILDQEWQEHLELLETLREGIHLRSYAQKKPQDEYRRDSFELFENTISRIQSGWIEIIMNPQYVMTEESVDAIEQNEEGAFNVFNGDIHDAYSIDEEYQEVVSNAPKTTIYFNPGGIVKRNDPCPCGSGQKYKECHGKLV